MKPIRSAVTCSPGTRYAPETDTLWLALSNATISCTTTATTVTVSLQAIGSVRVAVFLQEKMVMDFVCMDETKTISIPCPSESAQQIQICKLSEPHYGILGVSALICDGGTCSPLPPAPHHLAFIGDSITCGYGIDAAPFIRNAVAAAQQQDNRLALCDVRSIVGTDFGANHHPGAVTQRNAAKLLADLLRKHLPF